MAQIAYGGILGFIGGTSFSESYFLTPEGFLSNANGDTVGSSVFSEDLVALHRTRDIPIVPDRWTSWLPDPENNEWDKYSIGNSPTIGTATMVDGSHIDTPSLSESENIGGAPRGRRDDHDHDTINYRFDPTAAAWQDLAYGETLTVTFTVSAEEYSRRGILQRWQTTDTDTFTVTLRFIKVCFARGTIIETINGPVAIESIRPGTLVQTLNNGAQPVQWIGSSVIGSSYMRIPDNLKPIRIKAGALGTNTPSSDLLVSPQHRVLIRSHITQKMFGTDEVLVPAKQLLQVEGIDVDTKAECVEYFHMMFDQHQIVTSNGTLTESLYLGAEALKGLGVEAVNEILDILPQLRDVLDGEIMIEAARILVSGRQARKLAVRHIQNKKAFVT